MTKGMKIACGGVTDTTERLNFQMRNDPHGQASTQPEPPTTRAALFFGCVFKPDLMLSLESPGGLPEQGMQMLHRGVDVVATHEPAGTGYAKLVEWSRERRAHLLVARMRPGHASDTVFELIYNQLSIITVIRDLALYVRHGTNWYLCPMRNDPLHFCLDRVGIEPEVSVPCPVSTSASPVSGTRQLCSVAPWESENGQAQAKARSVGLDHLHRTLDGAGGRVRGFKKRLFRTPE